MHGDGPIDGRRKIAVAPSEIAVDAIPFADSPRRRLADRVLIEGGYGFPASFGQLRLWALDQITPAAASYNMPVAFALAGPLDRDALTAALALVSARHDALRTHFTMIDGGLVQIVNPRADSILALSSIEAAAPGALEEAIEREVRRPFVLSRGPLLRWSLFTRAPDDHVLLGVMHHAVGDQISLDIVADEVRDSYAAFAAARQPELPTPWQYGDYCDWAVESGLDTDGGLDFWTERLAEAPALSTFPVDRPRPPVQSDRGALTSVELTGILHKRLSALALAHGATPFMVFLAALKASLYLETRQSDLLVGIPIAGREIAEVDRTVGFFVNTVVVRSRLGGDTRFTDLLAQVRDGVLAGIAHQFVPFEDIVAAVLDRRDPSHAPLFQIMVNAFEQPEETVSLGSLTMTPVRVQTRPARFDMTLNVVGHGHGRHVVEIEYNADLFDGGRMRRLLHDYCSLLGEIADAPGLRLGDLAVPATSPPQRSAGRMRDGPRRRTRLAGRDAFIEPRDDVEAKLQAIWQDALDVSPIGITADFFDLGGNSLRAIALVGRVRREFGQALPVSTLFVEPTIARMARELRAGAVSASSIAPLCTTGNLPPLFAAGSNHRYLELSRALGPDQPFYKLDIYRLQELRRGQGLAPFASVEEIAACFVDEMLKIQPHGPYFVAGQCEGGIVALEIGRQLKRMGHDVALMMQFDTPVRGYFRRLNWLRRMLINIGRGEFGKKMRKSMRRHIPSNTPEVPAESQHLELQAAIWSGIGAYRPLTRYPGEVVLLRATESYGVYEDVAAGWDEAVESFVVYDVPGDHLRFFSHSDSQAIVADLLHEAQQSSR